MKLSEKEEKYLLRFEKTVERIYLNYIAVGLLFCIAIFGMIVGVKLKNSSGFLIAIFFGTLSINLLVISITYQKLYKIMMKIKQNMNK